MISTACSWVNIVGGQKTTIFAQVGQFYSGAVGQYYIGANRYNNADVWLHNYIIFLVPVLKVLPNGYAAYALATTLMAALISLGFWIGLRLLHVSHRPALAAVAVLTSGISSPFIANLLFDWGGHYGSSFLLAFLQLALLIRIMEVPNSNTGKKLALWTKIVIFSILVFIAALSNPSRAALFNFVPYIMGLGLFVIQQPSLLIQAQSDHLPERFRFNAPVIMTLVFAIFAFILGAYYNSLLTGGAIGLAKPVIYGAESLMRHIVMIITSWLFLLGYPTTHAYNNTGVNINLLSLFGLYSSVRIIIVLVLSLLTVSFLKKFTVALTRGVQIPLLISVPTIGFLIGSFIHIVSFRYPLENDYTSIRYIFVPFMLILACWVVLLNDSINRIFAQCKYVLCFFMGVICVGYVNHVFPALNKPFDATVVDRINPYERLVSCLKKEGLQYGYGGFWSSNILTVLSNSNIRVRPVSFFNKWIDPFPIHSSVTWYKPAAWQGNSFLLLTEAEKATIDRKWLSNTLGESNRILMCDEFTVLEYDYNISKRLFGNFDKLQIDLNESTLHQIGKFDIANHEMVALAGEQGYLLYGPYVTVKMGKYEAVVSINSQEHLVENSESLGVIDVVAGSGSKLLARYDIMARGGWQEITLPFMLDTDVQGLEVRVFSNGRTPLRLKGPIRISRLSNDH
ncbi:hypothetical protein [Pollutimonas bauzanensis]|uniref:hypothetical protein n=1 Tax=Pollutimonas bauzanensis TaxID=658167 RepID=UPI0015B50DE8|nr:hypothetical protein [Pollutimonas bauzanensis]